VDNVPKVVVDEESCKGCELCVEFCPRGSLSMSSKINNSGYFVAELVNEAKCNSCALCALMCPEVALRIYKMEG